MCEIVKYNNYLNSLHLKNFTSVDLNFFTTICARVKEQKFKEVKISFKELKQFSNYKAATKSQFVDDIIRMNNKLISSIVMNVQLPSGTIATFPLFSYFLTDVKKEEVRVKVNSDWYFIFNELTSNFTQFELVEFVALKNKYSKILFKLFKQYKTTGLFICDIDTFRKIVDVPSTYTNKYIMDKIIKPSLIDLKPYFKNLKVTPLYKQERGKPLQGFKFTFKKENVLKDDTDKKVGLKVNVTTNKKNKFNNFQQSNYSQRFYDLIEIRMGRGLTKEEEKEYLEELSKGRR